MNNDLFDGGGKVLKEVPEAYKDLAQPTVKEMGKLMSTVPRAINAALAPLHIWIAKQEYNIERTKELLAIELQNISPSNIVPPEPYVAVPAIQAISYCMDSEELRTMYAKLLARSMDIDTKDKVHPAIVEIIKQLSPLDAKFLKTIFDNVCPTGLAMPLISLHADLDNGRRKNVSIAKYISEYEISPLYKTDEIMDNLIRCKLIDFYEDHKYHDDKFYDSVRNSQQYFKTKKHIRETFGISDAEIYEYYNYAFITTFGMLLCFICIDSIP